MKICSNCGSEYTPENPIETMGVKIPRDYGLCPQCEKEHCETLQARELAQHQAEIANKRKEARHKTGISHLFMYQDFSTFEAKNDWQKKVYKKCLKYADEFPVDSKPFEYPSLLIYSEHSWGVGKTHLVCAIAHRILDRWAGQGSYSPPKIKFVTEPELFQAIQGTYNYNYEEQRKYKSESAIIAELTRASLLIIDDIGKVKRRDPTFVQNTLFGIINGRYNNKLPLILTANLSPHELLEYLGGTENKASYDRLMGMCGGRAISIEGDSWRT